MHPEDKHAAAQLAEHLKPYGMDDAIQDRASDLTAAAWADLPNGAKQPHGEPYKAIYRTGFNAASAVDDIPLAKWPEIGRAMAKNDFLTVGRLICDAARYEIEQAAIETATDELNGEM